MKSVFIIIISIAALSLTTLIFNVLDSVNHNDIQKIGSIKTFHFTYTNGYAANAFTYYDIRLKDGNYKAYIKLNGVPAEEAVEIEMTKEQVQKVEEILNKYKVYKWNGFDKTDKDVLDGDSFSLNLSMENGKSIGASGYMAWPDNYREVKAELSTFFEGLLK